MATPIFTGPGAMERATALDQIHDGLTKAQAMLCMTCGGGGESFRDMAPMYQDNFLWVVSDLVDSALEGFSHLMDEREAKVQQTKARLCGSTSWCRLKPAWPGRNWPSTMA